MGTGETDELATNVPNEPADMTPEADVESTSKPVWSRRTFLKAAALGAAAYGVLGKLNIAAAEVVTNVNCTANDVRIHGPGIVINEPCTCTKTCTRSDGTKYACFDAQVKFTLINNTGTDRYCVTIHLCPGMSSSGVSFPAQDIVIGTVGPGTHDLIATIPDYPCGAGTVCFGEAGSGEDGGFAKGETCPTGKCCTVISWNVRPNDPCPLPYQDIIKSKCRAQRVCIVGRGTTTLDCDTSASGVQSNCPVECGSSTTLRLCTTNDASLGPFTFTLGGQSFGPTNDTCHDFTVGPITKDTTITGDVKSNDGCTKSASVTLTTSPITVSLDVSGGATCDSAANSGLKFTASTGKTGCTYEWKVDGTVVSGVTGDTFNYPANPDNVCQTVSVTATCGGCISNTASKTVKQCVNTITPCT